LGPLCRAPRGRPRPRRGHRHAAPDASLSMAQTPPPAAPAADAPLKGMALLTLGVCVFVSQDVIIKLLSGGYPIHEMLFIRCITGLPFVITIAWWQRNPAAFRFHWAGVLRGVLHFISFTCYYLAL